MELKQGPAPVHRVSAIPRVLVIQNGARHAYAIPAALQRRGALAGVYTNLGPMRKGLLSNTGTTVVLDTGRVEIVIISRHQEPYDLSCLLSARIDPRRKHYVILKSRVHWRAGMGELAREVVECAGMGVATSDYSQLTFRRMRRPIYPLDAIY